MKKTISRHPEYYEAILQIRPVKNEVLDFIRESINKKGDVHISKVIELKTGVDIYLDNQRYVRSVLGPQLKKRFKGDLVISKSLYGKHRMTSRMIYRATVLFRLKEKPEGPCPKT